MKQARKIELKERGELNFASSGLRLFVRKEDREKAEKIIKKAEE